MTLAKQVIDTFAKDHIRKAEAMAGVEGASFKLSLSERLKDLGIEEVQAARLINGIKQCLLPEFDSDWYS